MPDIALGVQVVEGTNSLEEFARAVGAAGMTEWIALGLFDENIKGWGAAFDQAMTRTLEGGFRVHFELRGVDIRDAFCGDPEEWVGRYTAWELQQIVARRDWFTVTSFYLNGRLLDVEELGTLGIKPPW